jgi:hypothetical protein
VCGQGPDDVKGVLVEMAQKASKAIKGQEPLLSINPLTDTQFGFLREEMGKENLVGTVKCVVVIIILIIIIIIEHSRVTA